MENKYDRRLFLKIKLKNLRDEIALIRAQEKRLKRIASSSANPGTVAQAEALVHQMAAHRKWDIRDETRATLLAYGYIRGRRYDQIEHNPKYEPAHCIKGRVERVAKMANKYIVMSGCALSPGIMEQKIREWMSVDDKGNRLKKAA